MKEEDLQNRLESLPPLWQRVFRDLRKENARFRVQRHALSEQLAESQRECGLLRNQLALADSE